jgi:hypothetical protein
MFPIWQPTGVVTALPNNLISIHHCDSDDDCPQKEKNLNFCSFGICVDPAHMRETPHKMCFQVGQGIRTLIDVQIFLKRKKHQVLLTVKNINPIYTPLTLNFRTPAVTDHPGTQISLQS